MPPENRTLRAIFVELVGHPFFPLTFIGKFTESLVTNSHTLEFGIFALVSTILWVFSDAIDVDIDTDKIIG